jgi:O-antigen/teichoic acid export membrane protein
LSKVRKLASQTVLYGFTYFAGRLLNFFLTPYYTRIFQPDDFGTISLIYAYITFFNILYTYGMETGYFYFANKEKDGEPVAGTTFLSLFYSSLLFSGLLLVFSPFVARFIGYSDHVEYVVYAALILLFDTLAVLPFAYLRKQDKALRFATLKFTSIALNIIFNFFFLSLCPFILNKPELSFLHPLINAIYEHGHGVRYVFISNVLSSVLILLFMFKEIRSIRLSWHKDIWQAMLKYSWPLLILGFAGMINETLDRILLSRRLPGPLDARLVQVGIYSACYKLSIFMTLAIASFRYAAEPFFFAQMKDGDGKDLFARILKYFSFVTGLIFLGIMMYLPMIIHLIGKNFRSGLEVVPILLLANLFLGVFYYLSQWYKQTNKTLYGAYVSIGGAIITLIVNFAFIPAYGYMASAWATFLSYFFMAVTSYFLGQKFFPVKYQTGRILLYIGLPVALFYFSHFISGRDIGQFSLSMYLLNTIFIVLYIMLFFYIEKPAFLSRIPMMRRNNGRTES